MRYITCLLLCLLSSVALSQPLPCPVGQSLHTIPVSGTLTDLTKPVVIPKAGVGSEGAKGCRAVADKDGRVFIYCK
jgi:hypothetical protein